MSNEKLLSVVMICGDEGTKTLARALKSVIDRDGGPLCDEIVIGWNGKDDAAFLAALKEVGIGEASSLLTDPDPRYAFIDLVERGENAVVFGFFRQQWSDDFAAARNEVAAKASGVWQLYLDTDDVIPGASAKGVADSLKSFAAESAPTMTLKEYLARLPADVNCVEAPYHYVIGGSGEVLQVLQRRRIIRWADGFYWHNRIHEDVAVAFGKRIRKVGNAGLVIEHYPVESRQKKLERNARIIRRIAAEADSSGESMDHRTLFNLGTIALEEGDYAQAATFLRRASDEAIGRGVLDDAVYSRFLLVRAYLLRRQFRDAISTAGEILALAPRAPEGYLSYIDACYQGEDWKRVVDWYEQYQHVPRPARFVADRPVERQAWPAAWAAEAYLQLERYDDALAAAQKAVEYGPQDVFCQQALTRCEEAKRHADAVAAVKTLVDYHLTNGHVQGAVAALDAGIRLEVDAHRDERIAVDAAVRRAQERITGGERRSEWTRPDEGTLTTVIQLGPQNADALDNPTSLSVRKEAEDIGFVVSQLPEDGDPARCRVVVRPGIDYLPDEVTIYAPAYNENWAPEWVATQGIGGSEEAIVYFARELAARGYKVTVYGPAQQPWMTRTLDGVEWRRLREFDFDSIETDVLIAHRAPWVVRQNPRCRRLFIWHHDHAYDPREWTPEIVREAEHLFVSNWQRQVLWELLKHYAPVNGSIDDYLRGVTIGNGVPAEQALIDTSLASLPRDAKRVVYCSQPIRGLRLLLDVWPEILAEVPDAELHLYYGKHTNRIGAQQNATVRAELDAVEARLRDAKRVTDHGRIPQPMLMDELRKASVWAYPCIFPEVSCIAGLRAAAAGCIPIFLSHGSALGETQPEQSYAVAKPWSEGGREEFVGRLLAALKGEIQVDRDLIRADAIAFHTWSSVVDRFEAALESKAVAGEMALTLSAVEGSGK